MLSKLCLTFTERLLKIRTLMAVFELIHLVLNLSFYEIRSHKSIKIIQSNCFVVNNLFSVQLKQGNTKYSCFTADP